MDIIDEKSQRLKRLIEDLIEASKVAAGSVTVNKTMINLNELAAQAVVEFAQGFENRSLELVFDEPRESHIVFADGTKIYRVFENLLSNAQKYSAPGSRVYIRLYSSGGFGCFEIKNISKDALNISRRGAYGALCARRPLPQRGGQRAGPFHCKGAVRAKRRQA